MLKLTALFTELKTSSLTFFILFVNIAYPYEIVINRGQITLSILFTYLSNYFSFLYLFIYKQKNSSKFHWPYYKKYAIIYFDMITV